MRVLVWSVTLLTLSVQAFVPCRPIVQAKSSAAVASTPTTLWSTYEDEAPSDFNTEDLEGEKSLSIDENEEDAVIRDALKRELLLLSSITNRGEYASVDDQNVITDLVAQLEALNDQRADPTQTSVEIGQRGTRPARVRWCREYGLFEQVLPTSCELLACNDL